MADEIPVTQGSAVITPAVAPVADAAVVNPAAAASLEAPKVEAAPAPAVETKPEVKTETKPESQPSLLEAAAGKAKPEAEAKAKVEEKASPESPAPADAKPAETKAEEKKPDAKVEAKDDAKATDQAKEATAEQPPAPVKYEAFKVPEGIKLDDKELSKFTDVIGGAQVKQEDAQKLIDLYVAERQRDVDAARTEQREYWNKLNDTWKTETRKDDKLGGNRLETSLSMAKAFIEEYGGSPDQVRELMAHLNNNGMGNFVGFIRLAHNAAVALNVFEDSMVPANPTAPKADRGPGNRGWYKDSMGAS